MGSNQTQKFNPGMAGVVWNGKHVPRWAFIICLAVQQRLSNFDRLVSCGMSVNDDCKLCGRGRESHQYLFFECSYSRSIWQKVRFKCSILSGPWMLRGVDWYVSNVRAKVLAACFEMFIG